MGHLLAAACECGRISLPPRDHCRFCSGSTKPVEIGDIGMILTYTVLHVAPVGFEPPCVLGLIQLVENGKTNGSDRDQNLPKLVCIGDVPEDWVQVERKVRVKKIDERYHFEPV